MFLKILELTIIVSIILMLILQVFIPAVTGTPMFPFFKKKTERQKKIESDLALNERLDDIQSRVERGDLIRERVSLIEDRLNAIDGKSMNTDTDTDTDTKTEKDN